MRWTIGAKLTAWSALIVGTALLIGSVGATLFIQQEQIEALDDRLNHEAHTFFRAFDLLEREPVPDLESAIRSLLSAPSARRYAEVIGVDGVPIYISASLRDAKLKPMRRGLHTIKVGKTTVRMGAFYRGDATLYLGSELSEINADSAHLILVLGIVLPLLIATVAGGGWLLAHKALAPIREITTAAGQITAERLGRRLPQPRTSDEVARLTDVLNAMFDRLEVSFHQAMRFSADASHELKTPLTLLRAGIEDLLESPTLTECDQRAVSALLEQTRKLTSITQSLLLLARADAGRLKLDLGEKDAVALINACVEDAHILADRCELQITTDLPSSLPALLDAGRFSQILLNLLENAVKYNREGGEIAVTAKQRGDAICITVGNTGPGIPKENAAKIFERFFRFEPQPGTTGHGLGLSLARELARAHGGDLVLTRSDAEWTIFSLTVRAVEMSRTPLYEAPKALAYAG